MYFDAKPPKLESCQHCHSGAIGITLLDFIEDNAAGLIYPEYPDNRSYDSEHTEDLIVGAW